MSFQSNNFSYSSGRRPSRRPATQNRTGNNGKSYKNVIYLAIIIFFFQFIYFGFWVDPASPVEQNQEEAASQNVVTISINPGESLKNIAKILKKENVINSKTLFVAYAKYSNQDTKIQSGVFTIPLPQNIPSTLEIITTVPKEDKITIPEGYKIRQIDQLLTDQGLINQGEFINCVQTCDFDHPVLNFIPDQSVRNLEGFLFPDTYFISRANFTPESLIIKMMDNFMSKLPTDWKQKAEQLPLTDLYSIINMASIIEREVLSQKDKQLVSGLLWKRYRSDWLIDADAALLYEKDDNKITTADLNSDSPYNIRRKKGLPPTPISNPGVSSIEAALNPIESDYWFYLTTLDTGAVKYAETYEQHNQNIDRYLR